MTTTTDKLVQALLPCPFCGAAPRISRMRDESLWSHDRVLKTSVRCDECDIATDYTEAGQNPEAVEKWNTRAQPPQALAEKQEAAGEAVASIYITESGEREFDDWKCPLPVGRNTLYTHPSDAEALRDAIRHALMWWDD